MIRLPRHLSGSLTRSMSAVLSPSTFPARVQFANRLSAVRELSSPAASSNASTHRPRRSVLYMPGSNAKAINKAKGLPADVIIMDLEDAVAPDAKVTARQQVVKFVQEGGFGLREVVVRANGLDTQWGEEDIAAIAKSGAAAVALPKVEGRFQVEEAHRLLAKHGAPASMKLWCMIETPLGVLRTEEICSVGKELGRLQGLIMGTSDLTKELRAVHTPCRHPLLPSLQHVLLCARAFSLLALDGVHLDIKNLEEFTRHCQQAMEMGYDGKTLIHPSQLEITNQTFAPSPAQVQHSQRVIDAHAQAVEAGSGVVLLDGKLIENLHVDEAHRIIQVDAAIKELQAAAPPS